MSNKNLGSFDTSAEMVQRDKKILDYLAVILGFGLCRAWIVFCLSAPLTQKSFYAFNWMFLVAGALAALFAAFVIGRLKESTERIRRSLFLATGISLVLSGIIIPFSLFQHIELLLFTGFIVGGVGAGMLQILWGERFAAHEVKFATIASPAAAIITAFLVSVTPPEADVVGYVLLPLLSFGFLAFMTERSGIKVKSMFEVRNWSLLEADPALIKKRVSSYAETKVNPTSSFKNDESDAVAASIKLRSFNIEIGKLMFSIMIFSFLCRVFDAIPLGGTDPFAFFGGSPLFSLVVVGAIFLLFAAIFKDRFNPTLTYRLSLPIMVAGFIAIALFFDTHAALSVLLINIGYEFFDILSWILFTEISRKEDENPLRIFGLGVAFMFIGMALGYLSGELLNALIINGGVQITVIAMMSIFSLVVVGFLVMPEGTIEHLANAIRSDKNVNEKEVAKLEPANDSRLESSCALVSESYHLTPRESEVLVLLAYGRTLAIIARDLQIAKGTARTHIENIYRKLDVHKQQELIDLVDNYEPR